VTHLKVFFWKWFSEATFEREHICGIHTWASFYFWKSTFANGTSSIPESFLHMASCDWPVRIAWCYCSEFHGRYTVPWWFKFNHLTATCRIYTELQLYCLCHMLEIPASRQ